MAKIYRSVPAAVKRMFVHGVVQHEPRIEGQRVDAGGVVKLGSRCGPTEFDLLALLHEMAHMVEIDDARVGRFGWGLRTACATFQGRDYPDPQTDQAVRRECRVLAFQVNFQTSLGIGCGVGEFVKAMRHVPGYCYVGGDRLVDGRRNRTDEERDSWITSEIERLHWLPKFSADAFATEWKRKVALLTRRLRKRATKPKGRSATALL